MWLIGVLCPSVAIAEQNPPYAGFLAVPSLERTSARTRLTLGTATQRRSPESEPVVIASLRIALRVSRRWSLTMGVSGEADDLGFWSDSPVEASRSAHIGSPFAAGVFRQDVGEHLAVLVRAIAAVAVASETNAHLGVASSLLAHDPAITWSAAHAGTVQVAMAGTGRELQWGVAVAAIGLVTDGMTIRPRSHALVRVDGGIAGWLNRCWSWEIEVGAISDVVDEGTDEGTDVVPVWNVGVRHHHGSLSLGFSTSGGWIGGDRRDLLGPSVTFEIGGLL